MDVTRDPSDEELALRAQDGDDAAFQILFDRHAPALRRQIQRRLPPLIRRKVDESDVVQMAYLGVHRGLVRRWRGWAGNRSLKEAVEKRRV